MGNVGKEIKGDMYYDKCSKIPIQTYGHLVYTNSEK